MKGRFNKLACAAAKASGSLSAFVGALAMVLIWAATGPIFHFNETWQLVINTGTTIITFLMVFLIQNTQNSDTTAMQIKLDELIRATEAANNELLNLEEMDQIQLEEVRAKYESLAKTAADLKIKKSKCMPISGSELTPESPSISPE